MDYGEYTSFCQYPACSVKASHICGDCTGWLFVCDTHGREHKESTKHIKFQKILTDIKQSKLIEILQDMHQTVIVVNQFKFQAIKTTSDIVKGIKDQLNMLLKSLNKYEIYLRNHSLFLKNCSKVNFFTIENLKLLKIQKKLIFPTKINDAFHPFNEMLLSLQKFSIPVFYAMPQNLNHPDIYHCKNNQQNPIMSLKDTLPKSKNNLFINQSNLSCVTVPVCSSSIYTSHPGSPNSVTIQKPNSMTCNEGITYWINQRIENPNEILFKKTNSYIRSYCFDCRICTDIYDKTFICCGKERCSICKKEVHSGQSCHKANSKFLEEIIECPKCGDSAKRSGYTVKISCPFCKIYCIVCFGSLDTHNKLCENLYFSNSVQ